MRQQTDIVPQTPVVSRKGRKRSQRPTAASTTTTNIAIHADDEQQNKKPKISNDATTAVANEGDDHTNNNTNIDSNNNNDNSNDEEYFQPSHCISIPSLIQKFNFLVVHINTHKRKRLGDLTVESLKQNIKDLELQELRMIVSMLPHAFRFYYPKEIIHSVSANYQSNRMNLCLDVMLDGMQLFAIVSQFHALCKQQDAKFKMIALPPIPTIPQPQPAKPKIQSPVKPIRSSSTSDDKSDTKATIVTSSSSSSSATNRDEILSETTLKQLAENEKKRELKSLMDRDLKRRMKLAKILEVATLTQNIMKMEGRCRMKLNQLKNQIVSRSLNTITRSDVSITINHLLAIPEQKWCHLESLNMQDEKVFVIESIPDSLLDVTEPLDTSNEVGLDNKCDSFAALKAYLEEQLKSHVVVSTEQANNPSN